MFSEYFQRWVERLIVKTLTSKFPDVAVIGEEDGDSGTEDDAGNVIDRLDQDVMKKTFPTNLQNVDPSRVRHNDAVF